VVRPGARIGGVLEVRPGVGARRAARLDVGVGGVAAVGQQALDVERDDRAPVPSVIVTARFAPSGATAGL
jgi:hypothetical protein